MFQKMRFYLNLLHIHNNPVTTDIPYRSLTEILCSSNLNFFSKKHIQHAQLCIYKIKSPYK